MIKISYIIISSTGIHHVQIMNKKFFCVTHSATHTLSFWSHAAHNLIIVRNDLKPQNIFLKFPPPDVRNRGLYKVSDLDNHLADFNQLRFTSNSERSEI